MPANSCLLPRRAITGLCLLAGAGLLSAAAWAAYPDRPIKLIVPYPPGGATDVIGRIVAQHLSQAIGQPVVIDNRGGAGGNIGAEAAAKAPADGYTLLMGAVTSHSTMATLEKGKLRYSITQDLVPIMLVGSVPLVVVVNTSVPARTLKEFVAYGKATPDKLTYASSGAGSPQRMAAEILRRETGIRMLHIPYKGSGPAMTDVVGGQVTMMIETAPASMPFIKSGQLRALAVTTPQRISMLPDVPTTAEEGLPAVEVSSTFGVLAPAATPRDILDKLNAALAKMVTLPAVKEQFLQQGVYSLPPATIEKSTEQLSAEVARWHKLITDTGIKSEE